MKSGYKPNGSASLKGYDSSPSKPYLSLTTKDLPDIKSWEVGKSYDVKMTIKQTVTHQYSDGQPTSASFDVTSIEPDDSGDEGD